MYKDPARSTDHRRGVMATIAVHAVVLLCMFVMGVKYLDPPPLSGVVVAFGVDADAAGTPTYDPRPQHTIQNTSSPSSAVNEIPEEQLVTQDIESPVEVKKVEKPTPKPTPTKKTTPKPKETTSSKSTTAPREEEKPVEKPRPSDATTSALANIFSSGTDASKGDGKGVGMKGAPDGSISSDKYGVSGSGGDGNYHLAGRRALTKPRPEYTGSDQGIVRVRIQVDSQGNVISAKCSLQGTEVTDPTLLRNAERAAMQTKWSANTQGDGIQEGYIIYNFRIGG